MNLLLMVSPFAFQALFLSQLLRLLQQASELLSSETFHLHLLASPDPSLPECPCAQCSEVQLADNQPFCTLQGVLSTIKGMIAGVFSVCVSHPPDAILTRMNQVPPLCPSIVSAPALHSRQFSR